MLQHAARVARLAWRRARPKSDWIRYPRLQGSAVVLVAVFLLLLGVAGTWWSIGSQTDLGTSLASAMPGLFPSPTPTATSTPTVEEQVAILLAEADQAWQQMDAGAAIRELQKAQRLQPGQEEIRRRLFVAHSTLGLKLADAGRFQEALSHFDIALALQPGNERVQEARRLASSYASAAAYLDKEEYGLALSYLELVYAQNPDYHQVRSLLHDAHYQEGQRLQKAGLLWQAKAQYERALAIKPGTYLTEMQLRVVDYMLATPTPTVTFTPTPSPTPTATPIPEKEILIDVSQQRFYAYENDQVKWDFVCSTGREGAPTRRGVFQVLDKIPRAWGGTWSIWMPYWLGIYWAGGTENGIHALPVSLDGVELWSGYLGAPISFGCIVLDTYAAKLVYEWADIGTPVIIQD